MADGLILNFGAQRNEDYVRVWKLRPKGQTAGVDLTDCTVTLRINSTAGLNGAALISLSQTDNGNGSVIDLSGAADGQMQILLRKTDLAALPGLAADVIPFAYNLIVTDHDGIARANVRGTFTIEPGV